MVNEHFSERAHGQKTAAATESARLCASARGAVGRMPCAIALVMLVASAMAASEAGGASAGGAGAGRPACPCAAEAKPPTVELEGDPIDKLIAYLECLLRRLRGLPCEGDPVEGVVGAPGGV